MGWYQPAQVLIALDNAMRRLICLFAVLVATLFGAYAQRGFMQKSLLLERFTTEKCGNCPKFDKPLAQIVEDLRKEGYAVMLIAHHAGYGTDWLTLPGSEVITEGLFGKASFAPALSVNRWSPKLCTAGEGGISCPQCSKEQQSAILAFDVSKYSVEELCHHARLIAAVPTFARVKSIKRGVAVGEDTYNYTVRIETIDGVNPDDLYVTAVLVQEKVRARNQAGLPFGTQNYMHEEVIRGYATPALGVKVTPTGNEFEVELKNVSFKDEKIKNVNLQERRLVVMLHKHLQAEQLTERSVISWGSIRYGEELAAEKPISTDTVVPHPYVEDGRLRFVEEVDSYQLFDMNGRRIVGEALLPGSYVVRVVYQGCSGIYKVVVR